MSAPTITQQPTNQSVTVRQTATFTVSAVGVPTPTYRWSKNGTAISGATSASYITPPTTLSDNGATFTCVASNSQGNAPSNPATLTVTSAPVPVITSGSSLTGTASIAISPYQITATPGPLTGFNATGLPSGLGLNALTGLITGIPRAAGTYIANLFASNSAGTSSPFALNINISQGTTPAPDLSLDAAYAWPVPFKPSTGISTITFTGLKNGSTIKILTIMGELVAQLQSDGPSIPWNVTNKDGATVASGVYLYQIKNAVSEKRGKIVIIR